MRKSFEDKVINTEADTDKLNKIIFIIAIIFTILVSFISLLSGKAILAQSFLLGAIGSLFYLRMQILFVKNFSKRDLLSLLINVLSAGRILIILGVLIVAIKRVDLFSLYAVIIGLASVHIISISVFAYNVFLNFRHDKKKLIAN